MDPIQEKEDSVLQYLDAVLLVKKTVASMPSMTVVGRGFLGFRVTKLQIYTLL